MKKTLAALILCLYIIFLYLDITNADASLSSWLKFSSIILCFSLTLFPKRDVMLISAMALTILADWFLLIQNVYLPGVIVFCIVQIIYNVRHGSTLTKTGVYAVLCAIFAIAVGTFFNIGALNTVAILYASLILRTTILAFKTKNKYIIFGMCLFVLCDVSVAIHNLQVPSTFGAVSSIAAFSMWLFYLPSQFLLAQSRVKI